MKKQMLNHISFWALSLVVLAACGKKVAKTTSESDSASRTNGGLSVATSSSSSTVWSSSSSSSSGWGWSSSSSTSSSSTSSSSSSSSSSTNALRQCSSPIVGLSDNRTQTSELENALARFFFKTVVPDSERMWNRTDLNNKYWVNGRLNGVMMIQGNVTYCLSFAGTKGTSSRRATLRIEYEDAFAVTYVSIPSTKTYYISENDTSNEVDIIWMDQAGFIQIKGSESGATLRFANMPSTAALDGRSTTDRNAAPIALYLYQRERLRDSSLTTLDYAVTSFVYSPDMFLDTNTWYNSYFDIGTFPYEGTHSSNEKSRLRNIVDRYVDGDTINSATHPFNSNYGRYLIINGKLGNVTVSN